jgi:hypothetical protein
MFSEMSMREVLLEYNLDLLATSTTLETSKTFQGVEHLLAILRHSTRKTLTGQLLRTSMKEMLLETGLPQSFLSYSFDDYGYIATRSWIASTWKLLSD